MMGKSANGGCGGAFGGGGCSKTQSKRTTNIYIDVNSNLENLQLVARSISGTINNKSSVGKSKQSKNIFSKET